MRVPRETGGQLPMPGFEERPRTWTSAAVWWLWHLRSACGPLWADLREHRRT